MFYGATALCCRPMESHTLGLQPVICCTAFGAGWHSKKKPVSLGEGPPGRLCLPLRACGAIAPGAGSSDGRICCPQGRGVSHPSAPCVQAARPASPYPTISVVRSRRPAASELASESASSRSGRMIGACRTPGPGETWFSRAYVEWRCLRPQPSGQHRRSRDLRSPERSVAARRGEGRLF